MRKLLYIVGALGFVGSLALALLHYEFTNPTIASFALEAFKILLTFTLIALGGASIKGAIDALLDEQRAHRALMEQKKERQADIIKEFTDIFSQFYSVRKLYHSAKDHVNIYDPSGREYAELIKRLLEKSVDLEGRYGAIKILAINHFELPLIDLSTKRPDMQELTKKVAKLVDIMDDRKNRLLLIRHRLDLLGELYDEWRHALERNQKINNNVVGVAVWENYEALLTFFATAEVLG